MAEISTKARKALPAGTFALPEQRKYPLENASHVRNAAARLEAAKKSGDVSPSDYAKAKKAIAAAAKRFGIKSQYNMDLGVSDVSQAAPVAARRRRPLEMTVTHPDGHKVEIRHLHDDVYSFPGFELIAPVTTVEMSAAEPAKWIQLAKPGTFRGHRAGPFELNGDVFGQIVSNFKRDGQPIPIDHEHQSELPPGDLGPEGAPAQGWIRDMKIEAGNLYGLVEWNPKARNQIRANEYRYFSPAINFRAKDRVTGEIIGARMSSGAMTNSPYLAGMAPLAASGQMSLGSVSDNAGDWSSVVFSSRAGAMVASNLDAFAPKVRAALKMNELASMRECSDQVGRLRDLYETAPHAYATHQGVDLGGYTDALSSLMGMGGSCTVEQLLNAVQEMIDAAIAQHEAILHPDAAADVSEMEDEGLLTATDVAIPEGDTAMSVEFTAQLKDHEEKLVALTAQVETQKTEKAELSLKLKDAESRAGALEVEVKSLRDAETARVQLAQTDRVAEAFDTYKDKKALCAEDREAMGLTLRANPELFEKLYPRVSADKRHLLSNLTGLSVGAPAQRPPASGSTDTVQLSFRDLSRQIARTKHISLEAAQREAYRILKKAG
jgi:phage I-like protein